MARTVAKHENQWSRELQDLVRGACGGFLFGMPLLYTMEVWWIGSIITPRTMLASIGLTFAIVFLLNRTEGFRRRSRRGRSYEAFTDTIEAMAIGIVCSAFVLLLLQEISGGSPLQEILGKVLFESAPFTLGVALANQFLGKDDGSHQNDEQSLGKNSESLNATLSDIGGTLMGAAIIAFSIAPTDEIAMLAANVAGPWLLLILLSSLVISYGIVFEAGFSNQQKRRQQKGIFQRPLSETAMSYMVSLCVSAFMLWYFQRLTFDLPWTMWLEHSLLLSLPATIGGAAGRLAV